MNTIQTASNGMSDLRDTINTVKPIKMKVSVEKGVIILSGTVDSHLKKTAIEKAAARIPGVHYIINRMNVRIASPVMRKVLK